ncbi:hypothetical protein KGQ71_03580, partial [Patescibacteria group bacterium]|nr:hypothetical protein [Patescibacteria group bacterium]
MAEYADPTVMGIGEGEGVKPIAILILVAGILSVALAGFFWWQKSSVDNKTTAINQTIASQQAQIKALQPTINDLNTYNTAAADLHTVFDNQLRYEDILNALQSHLYKGMKVTALQIGVPTTSSANGGATASAATTGTVLPSVTLTGATSDFNRYAQIYASLTDQNAQSYFQGTQPLTLTQTKTASGSEVDFSFKFTLTDKIAHPNETTTP